MRYSRTTGVNMDTNNPINKSAHDGQLIREYPMHYLEYTAIPIDDACPELEWGGDNKRLGQDVLEYMHKRQKMLNVIDDDMEKCIILNDAMILPFPVTDNIEVAKCDATGLIYYGPKETTKVMDDPYDDNKYTIYNYISYDVLINANENYHDCSMCGKEYLNEVKLYSVPGDDYVCSSCLASLLLVYNIGMCHSDHHEIEEQIDNVEQLEVNDNVLGIMHWADYSKIVDTHTNTEYDVLEKGKFENISLRDNKITSDPKCDDALFLPLRPSSMDYYQKLSQKVQSLEIIPVVAEEANTYYDIDKVMLDNRIWRQGYLVYIGDNKLAVIAFYLHIYKDEYRLVGRLDITSFVRSIAHAKRHKEDYARIYLSFIDENEENESDKYRANYGPFFSDVNVKQNSLAIKHINEDFVRRLIKGV